MQQNAVISAIAVTDKSILKKVEESVKEKLTGAIGKYLVLDINMMAGSQIVQPNGKVVVTLSIPSVLDASKQLAIYRMEENGTFTELPSTVKDGKISFETDHFSTYIVAEKIKASEAATGGKNETAQGSEATGDNSNTVTYRILLCMSMVVITAAVLANRKKKKGIES